MFPYFEEIKDFIYKKICNSVIKKEFINNNSSRCKDPTIAINHYVKTLVKKKKIYVNILASKVRCE